MNTFLLLVLVHLIVVNLASRPPEFLGSASSAPEGLVSHYGANLERDQGRPLTKVPHLSSSIPNTTFCADQEQWQCQSVFSPRLPSSEGFACSLPQGTDGASALAPSPHPFY